MTAGADAPQAGVSAVVLGAAALPDLEEVAEAPTSGVAAFGARVTKENRSRPGASLAVTVGLL